MLLYGTVCVSLIWMHFSFKPERTLPASTVPKAPAAPKAGAKKLRKAA